MTTTCCSIDRDRPRRLVSAQPRAVRGDLRSDRSGGLLQPADRAAQPDRVLRGAPAGVQRDRVPAPRARAPAGRRAARAAVRARHRSGHRSVGRPAQRRVHRRGRRATRSAPSRRACDEAVLARDGALPTGPGAARRALHRARARGDAPGDAALHVASAAVRAEARRLGPRFSTTERRRSGIADRTSPLRPRSVPDVGVSNHPGRDRDARARLETASPSGGTTSSTRTTCTVPAFDVDVLPVTNAQFLEFVECGRLPPREICGATKAGSGFRPRAWRIRRSGCPDPRRSDDRPPTSGVALARHVRGHCRSRSTGRST